LPDVICDTSPFQYLFQLGYLHILPSLAERVIVPPAVIDELAAGRAVGVSLPEPAALDWVIVRQPTSLSALPLINDLGAGEIEVLMLGLELPEAVVVLDDALARRVAETLNLRLTGTLGLLLDAKRKGIVPALAPVLDQLEALRFRLAAHTRAAVLKLAEEND
jgi:predicted nucleic acid-binding protein